MPISTPKLGPRLVALSLLALLACHSSNRISSSTDQVNESGKLPGYEALLAGPSPIKRLTPVQYKNAVQDIFNYAVDLSAFPGTSRIGGYDTHHEALTLTVETSRYFFETATEVADHIVENKDLRDTLMGCDPSAGNESSCVDAFIEAVGRRVHRAPLSSEELSAYKALYSEAKESAVSGEVPVNIGVSQVITAFLMSPKFLFRSEVAQGAPGDDVPVTGYELASRLSFTLWDSVPDDTLLNAARDGELETSSELMAQATRMLEDTKATRDGGAGIGNFLFQFFKLYKLSNNDKDTEVYPIFTPRIRELMILEAKAFFKQVLSEGGHVEDLLTAPYTLVNDELAAYYGLDGSFDSSFKKVSLPVGRRGGAMTLGGTMTALAPASATGIVARGKFTTEMLLGRTVGGFPIAGGDLIIPPLGESSNRERFESSTLANPSCRSCHVYMDLPGFHFENLDAVGRWQTADRFTPNEPINANGEILEGEAQGTYNGAEAMLSRVASTDEFKRSFTRQFYQYLIARDYDSSVDDANVEALLKHFKESEFKIQDLLKAYLASPNFQIKKGVQS